MKKMHIILKEKPSDYVANYLESTMQLQNIYITSSDEYIKEGDWVLNISNNKIFKQDSSKPDAYTLSFWEKIILTTDQDLISDGVQKLHFLDKNTEMF
jgi:hypothetical protein